MLLVNRALLLVVFVFMMGAFVKKFYLLVECESIPMQHEYLDLNYEDTREFYSVSSLKKANNESSFIKLTFIVDHNLYHELYKNETIVFRFCQEIVRFANSLLQPYNIFIALIDIIIWPEEDKIDIDEFDVTVTHTRFKKYALKLLKNNHSIDHIVLLSYKQKIDPYVSSLENVDRKCDLFIAVANTNIFEEFIAARLIFLLSNGYTQIKKNKDLGECFKPMDSRFSYEDEFELYFKNPTKYEKKSCINKFMDEFAKTKTNLTCLKTKPDILYRKAVCGNNVTEPGEECDCTWLNRSRNTEVEFGNQCCDAATCRLKKTNYSCAFGECCDLNSCGKKPKNYEICRPAYHLCDVEEYCDGEAAFCPKDKFVNEGEGCSVKKCHLGSIDNGVTNCRAIAEYKGICNSKHVCQYSKNISSLDYKTFITDTSTSKTVHFESAISSKFYGSESQLTSTTVHSDSSISSKFYGSDSQWKTYFLILSAVILLIGITILSIYVHSIYMKKYRFRFHNQDQQRQTYNSSLRNGTINEPTTVNEDNRGLTETALGSFEMNSLSHQEHEYDELNTPSNIYENPSEIYQQCENTSSVDYNYTTAHSCPSTTSSGYLMPTAINSDNQQNIDDICAITIPKQQVPGYYENCDKSNSILDPIYEDCLYDEANHPQNSASSAKNHQYITVLRPLSTTSSGYQIPITSNSNN